MGAISQTIFSDAFSWIKKCILIKISLKFVPKGAIDNDPALMQIMAWHRIGDKPLSEACWPDPLTHKCGTRGRRVSLGLTGHIASMLNGGNVTLQKSNNCTGNNYCQLSHDDVIKWKHFPCYWPFVRGIHRSPVNSPHKGQWRGALVFSLICVWISRWVNNGEAGDLRRYRTRYDVTVMYNCIFKKCL